MSYASLPSSFCVQAFARDNEDNIKWFYPNTSVFLSGSGTGSRNSTSVTVRFHGQMDGRIKPFRRHRSSEIGRVDRYQMSISAWTVHLSVHPSVASYLPPNDLDVASRGRCLKIYQRGVAIRPRLCRCTPAIAALLECSLDVVRLTEEHTLLSVFCFSLRRRVSQSSFTLRPSCQTRNKVELLSPCDFLLRILLDVSTVTAMRFVILLMLDK